MARLHAIYKSAFISVYIYEVLHAITMHLSILKHALISISICGSIIYPNHFSFVILEHALISSSTYVVLYTITMCLVILKHTLRYISLCILLYTIAMPLFVLKHTLISISICDIIIHPNNVTCHSQTYPHIYLRLSE